MSKQSIRFASKIAALFAVAGIGVFASLPAHADTATANLSVSADVSNTCLISTSPIAFGSYDPQAPAAATASGAVLVTCTSGMTGMTIALGEGQNADTGSAPAAPLRRLKSGSDFLSYSLLDASNSAWGEGAAAKSAPDGDGTQHSMTVNASISAGQNVPQGSYTDTVLATVNF